MALADGLPAPSRSQPPAALNLSSNNPFRNRTSPSPSPASLQVSDARRDSNRMSRNPFLDTNAIARDNVGMAVSSRDNDAVNGLTADIFGDMSLLDKPPTRGPPPAPYIPRTGTLPNGLRRPEHASPVRRDLKPSHVRRNSESSIMDKERVNRRERNERDHERSHRTPRTESEERRRRERRKEREERHRREKERGGRTRQQRGLDLIDKLDVTGVFGVGVFHHDGPFDACNPHRNVKKDNRAPMQAFPAGSMNMALGGSGPVNSKLDLDRIHGRGDEGFSDYATTRKTDAMIFNPTDKVEPVHGQETVGLGTSTFLDGAPAPRSAVQRQESAEQSAQDGSGGGLSRKKSLAQRIRGMSNARRERPGEYRSPDARYNGVSAVESPPPAASRAISAGGVARTRYARDNEINPFDNEYDAAFDKKGAQIRVVDDNPPVPPVPQAPPARPVQPPNSPKTSAMVSEGAVLARSMTQDSGAAAAASGEEEKPSGGLLNRMKSLRGGRRSRPERRGSNY